MLDILIFFLMICSPAFVFVLTMLATNVLGAILFGLFSGIARLVLPKSTKSVQKPEPVEYNIKRTDRKPLKMRSKQGEIQLPWLDADYEEHYKNNQKYPVPGTKRFKEAQRLNMSYFVSKAYPFDYVVLGDRAAIEEVRKGNVLSKEEEHLIALGFGYDGRPFGEPWGIAQESLDGYLYAQAQGDFLKWRATPKEYEDFLYKGYEPTDVYEGLNEDIISRSEQYMLNTNHHHTTRLTQDWFDAYVAGKQQPIQKNLPDQPAPVVQLT